MKMKMKISAPMKILLNIAFKDHIGDYVTLYFESEMVVINRIMQSNLAASKNEIRRN